MMNENDEYLIWSGQAFIHNGEIVIIPEDTEELVSDCFGADAYWEEDLIMVMRPDGDLWWGTPKDLRRLWKDKFYEERGGYL